MGLHLTTSQFINYQQNDQLIFPQATSGATKL